MNKFLPLIFVLLWSSAFVTTKPIVDNSDPFAALAFRFFIVALGFFIYCVYKNLSLKLNSRDFVQSFSSGILFHGVYLGGVFFFHLKRYTNRHNCTYCNNAADLNKCFGWTFS